MSLPHARGRAVCVVMRLGVQVGPGVSARINVHDDGGELGLRVEEPMADLLG